MSTFLIKIDHLYSDVFLKRTRTVNKGYIYDKYPPY